MKAVRQHRYGPPEVLALEEVPDPTPGPGELLVRVSAAGVNYADALLRAHEPDPLSGYPAVLPVTPGVEVAGTVIAAGPDTDSTLEGTRVTSFLQSGGYAELAVVPAAAATPIPAGLDDNQALALYAQGATAVGVVEAARLTAEDTVLVTAAAGGVGSLVVQLAKRSGATVVAVASSERKLDLARKLGADRVVDYSRPGWTEEVGPVTVVLDSVGGAIAGEAYRLLPGHRGRMVIYGYASGGPAELTVTDVFQVGAALIPFSLMHGPRLLADFGQQARELAVAGELEPVIGDVLPLAEAARAHRALEDRSSVGKLILTP